jgi:hypothetical protein
VIGFADQAAEWIESHPAILRPEGLDSLGNIAIVNVAAIGFKKITQRR